MPRTLWNGAPDRALEDLNPRHKRCAKCKRLGDNETFKPGPMVRQEDGELKRVWHCAPKCKPMSNDHYNVRGPSDDGRDVPLTRRGLDAPEYAPVGKVPKAKKKGGRK